MNAGVQRMTVIIPARNEASTVAGVIARCSASDLVDQVVVVDNGSTDGTAIVARAGGAEVVDCPIAGLGHAIKAGLGAARNRWVMKVDADIRNFETGWVRSAADLIGPGVGMVKSHWDHEVAAWPETYFLIKPMLRRIDHRLAAVTLPISAIYAFDRTLVELDVLASDWAIDLDLVYRVLRSGMRIEELEIPIVQHNERPLSAYFGMADEILAYLLRILKRHVADRLVLVMAHADDAELWAGGSLAKHLLDGGSADLVILFGDAVRRAEADALAKNFKALSIRHAGLAENSSLDVTRLRDLLRDVFASQPAHAVVTHAPNDPHPDHASVARLTQAALLTLDPRHAPKQLLHCNGYFGGQLHAGGFEPDTFVDISSVAEWKYQAIRNHASQDPEFWIGMVRNMDAINGMRCGVERAEAFRRSPSLFYHPASPTLI